MAECGVEKYDKLPARVGTLDVDYLRYRLREARENVQAVTKWLEQAIKDQEDLDKRREQ